MALPIDYETLRVIWWLLIGVLLIGFAITDGFDLGAAFLLPFAGKTDIERRIIINTIGPVWEGNQVWFILGGGAIFAAWPAIYAVSFSAFYIAMFLLLLMLIIRPVGFKYRSKMSSPVWRSTWDGLLSFSGFAVSLVFGVAVGNVLQGIGFHFDNSLRIIPGTTFFGLFNPFALLCGLVSLVMITMQGAVYLAAKTEAAIQKRVESIARLTSLLLILLFSLGGIWIAYGIEGFQLTTSLPHDLPSNPLNKTVIREVGAWLQNYTQYPWFMLAPLLGVLGALLTFLLVKTSPKLAMIGSSLSLFGVISTVGVSMFPFMLPSQSHPNASLLVWDASSSHLTLFIMLIAALIFMPMIILYTGWVYRVMRGKVSEKFVFDDQKESY